MKKRIIAVIMALFLIFSGNFITSSADSGWDYDYDYDYGGDWDTDWGSDWDYGSDYDYDDDFGLGYIIGSTTGGGGGSGWGALITVIIIVVIIILLNNKNGRKPVSRTSYNNIPVVLGNEAFSKYPNFNKDNFLSEAFEIYKGIQTAWSEFDYDSIRKLTTDEMYNMYKMQLETLNIKNEKNIMKDFNKNFIGITDISEVNGVLTVKVRLNVSQKDYVINSMTQQVTRGNANMSFNVAYDLTFVNNVKKEVLNNCPNCGAPISNSGSQKCEYCNADLVGNSSDNWVLAKKETVKQWR